MDDGTGSEISKTRRKKHQKQQQQKTLKNQRIETKQKWNGYMDSNL